VGQGAVEEAATPHSPAARAARKEIPETRLPRVEELTPTPDPYTAFEQLAGLPHLVFFDSAFRHPILGRYSFLTADPFEWISARGKRTHVSTEAQPREPANPFAILAERLARFRSPSIAGLPPFQGGAAGVFGYDLCHHLERLPRPRHDEFQAPDLGVGLYDWVVAFDHRTARAWLISTGFPERTPKNQCRRAEERAASVRRRLTRGPATRCGWPGKGRNRVVLPSSRLTPQWAVPGLSGLTSNFSREAYLDAIRRAIEYVHAGDCFQVNVAQRLLYPALVPAITLYRKLRERNPATFAGYCDLGDFVVASASPERFVRVNDGEVETRPIKGTRPRAPTLEADEAASQELLQSAKDRAENVMIVDLLRNDFGRVCRYGSVRVAALCRLERYRYVHHLVSEVRGRLWPGLGALDLLRAAFPGGSVTGAPKIRAMEIIAELEPTARGPYCGCLGYIGFDGTADTSILIRTFTQGKGWLQFPVGGGIVADSVPEREYEETWHKAEGLLSALA
jgi:para-aminobenzoate synthetase component 1